MNTNINTSDKNATELDLELTFGKLSSDIRAFFSDNTESEMIVSDYDIDDLDSETNMVDLFGTLLK